MKIDVHPKRITNKYDHSQQKHILYKKVRAKEK